MTSARAPTPGTNRTWCGAEVRGSNLCAWEAGHTRRYPNSPFPHTSSLHTFRYPLISDLARILTEAYEAPILPLKNLEFFSDSAAKI